MVDENLLDVAGTTSIALGVGVVAAVLWMGGGLNALVGALEAAQPLVIGGLAAIVGGGALKTWLES